MRVEDILRAVRGELDAAGLGPLYMRRLSAVDGREGIVIKPGTVRIRNQYIDGSADAELPVRVICKRREALRAMADAEDAADALSLATADIDGRTAVITCDEDRVRELELSDAEYHVWEAVAVVQYEIEPKGR